MKHTLSHILFFLFCMFITVQAQESCMYRLILKDKGNPPYTLTHPEKYLSRKSIERRQKQGIPVDSTDFPIDTAYFNAILQTGAVIQSSSKWVGTVVVHVPDSNTLAALNHLAFVDTLYCVWRGNISSAGSIVEDVEENLSGGRSYDDVNVYGMGYPQISINNGQLLHEAGFRGEGMSIAVIDGGFQNTDKIAAFDQNKIIEVRNFSHTGADPLRINTDHGTRVLSCMLSDEPGEMVGTAPSANYYLYLSEVSGEEYPVEEDYWVAALEYADSTGVDVVNTSLGYSEFDDFSMSHSHEDLDGKTVPSSRAATMAVDKGMLLFIAAGNEGDKAWRQISIPGDAEGVITVGSVDRKKNRSYFSSVGYTADNRVKPDAMAMGGSTAVIERSGSVVFSNGTSYASPVLAGLGACLWQALPDLSNKEIVRLILKNSSQYAHPDSLYGYGIPDIYQAYAQSETGISSVIKDPRFLYVDMKENRLYVTVSPQECLNCRLIVFSSLGNKVIVRSSLMESVDIGFLPKGIYIAYLQIGQNQYVRKFIKM